MHFVEALNHTNAAVSSYSENLNRETYSVVLMPIVKRKHSVLTFQTTVIERCLLQVNCTCVTHLYNHMNTKAPNKTSC